MIHDPFISSSQRPSRRSAALVIVLASLVLLSVIILAFFTTVRMELQSSKSYSDNNETRMLADTAVNVVMAQIRQATTETDGNGIAHAWASQPGMIRTFDTTGTLVNAYKLYSSGTMQVNSQNSLIADLTATTNAMAGWSTQPPLFTDLNAGVAVNSSGTVVYPVLTPPSGPVGGFSINSANSVGASSTQVPMPLSWIYVLRDGTLVSPDAATGSVTTATFVNATTKPSAANPIVGRIAFWADDETCKVNINTAGGDGIATTTGGATDPTPIANATFWSPPYFCAPDDVLLATSQPAAGEIQRYPGHPATVALHNVLNDLGWTTLTSPQFYNALFTSGANKGTIKTPGLTPRYAYGGSEGGTLPVNTATLVPLVPANRLYATVDELLFQPNSTRTASTLNAGDTTTQQRIATAHFFLTAHSRAPELNLFGQPRISIWPVWDKVVTGLPIPVPTPIDNLMKFCATVNNGATTYYFTRNDCTLSNDNTTVTPTVTADINLPRNQQLLNYLDTLTASAIPGFGGTFQSTTSKWNPSNTSLTGQMATRQILTEIFDYIRTINIADIGARQSDPTTFSGYGYNGSGLPATNFIQYARPWVGYNSSEAANNSGDYQVAPSVNTNWPTGFGGYQGYGVFPRLTEAAIQFVALGSNVGGNNIPLSQNYTSSGVNTWPAGDGGLKMKVTSPATSKATYSAPSGMTAVQAFILLNFTYPAQMDISNSTLGTTVASTFTWVEIQGLNAFQLNGHSLNFTSDDAMIAAGNLRGKTSFTPTGVENWGDYMYGAVPFITMTGAGGMTRLTSPTTTSGNDVLARNPFYSSALPITNIPTGTMTFTPGSGPITINVYDGYSWANTMPIKAHLVQTYKIQFPASTTLPIPTVQLTGQTQPFVTNSVTAALEPTGWSCGASFSASSSDRWPMVHDPTLVTNSVIGSGDVVQSMVLTPQWSDPRMLAISSVPTNAFVAHPLWGTAQLAHSTVFRQGSPINWNTNTQTPIAGVMGTLVNGISTTGYVPTGSGPSPKTFPIVTPTLTGGTTTNSAIPNSAGAGDWDSGIGGASDGPWINKADEGNIFPAGSTYPYFTMQTNGPNVSPNFFSPDREVPSPGMFGSLSTGVDPTGTSPAPWQTLLFQPGTATHPGRGLPAGGPPYTTPPDHLLLDLFWMPVVEPYAISEPFSTAGKVNLNYQIEPFTYINRSTALRAVLATEKVAEVSASQAALYKLNTGYLGGGMTGNARVALNLDATLAQFDDKFNGTDASGVNSSTTPDIFRSASQICEEYLVPQGYTTASAFATDWYAPATATPNFALVGDNVRERPYTDIYARVTTKSNTFQVHYRVQSLQKIKTDPNQAQWVEGQDQITGEKRGSVVIERYLNPNPTSPLPLLPDAAGTPSATAANSLESLYSFRVVNSVDFHP